MFAQPYTGFPTKQRYVGCASRSNFVSSMPKQNLEMCMFDVHCCRLYGSWETFILGWSLFLVKSMHCKSLRDSTASPQYRGSSHPLVFSAASSMNIFKWRSVLSIKLIWRTICMTLYHKIMPGAWRANRSPDLSPSFEMVALMSITLPLYILFETWAWNLYCKIENILGGRKCLCHQPIPECASIVVTFQED